MTDAAAKLAASLGATAGLPTGEPWSVHVMGTDAWLTIAVDTVELERRARNGARGEALDRDMIRALDRLPSVHANLPAADLKLLRHAPSWVVTHHNATAIRRAAPPLRVLAALVLDDDWSQGLDRASSFAAFCPRVLALTGGAVAPTGIELAEADLYGIGVIDAREPEQAKLLLRPETPSKPFGPAAWLFAEKVLTARRTDPSYARADQSPKLAQCSCDAVDEMTVSAVGSDVSASGVDPQQLVLSGDTSPVVPQPRPPVQRIDGQ